MCVEGNDNGLGEAGLGKGQSGHGFLVDSLIDLGDRRGETEGILNKERAWKSNSLS